MTVTITAGGESSSPQKAPEGGTRRASLGTMPDFSFQGTGVRVQQIMSGSAAEAAGMLAGDVLVALDGAAITDLRSFSALLKDHSPGDEVVVTVLRDGAELELNAILGSR
jgi:S1-C subfamily serine protease